MNKITGNEPAMPTLEQAQSPEYWNTVAGLSIKQFALLKFMCALIKDTTLPHGSEDEVDWLAKTASILTDAYINELNK